METARIVEQALWNVIRTKTFFLLLQNVSTCWDYRAVYLQLMLVLNRITLEKYDRRFPFIGHLMVLLLFSYKRRLTDIQIDQKYSSNPRKFMFCNGLI